MIRSWYQVQLGLWYNNTLKIQNICPKKSHCILNFISKALSIKNQDPSSQQVSTSDHKHFTKPAPRIYEQPVHLKRHLTTWITAPVKESVPSHMHLYRPEHRCNKVHSNRREAKRTELRMKEELRFGSIAKQASSHRVRPSRKLS